MSDQPPLAAEAVEVFVASLRQRSAPVNTIKSYGHDLRLFVQAVPPELPAVTPEAIEQFLAGDGHLSSATRRRRYSTLCVFFRWLIRHEIVDIVSFSKGGQKGEIGKKEKRKAEDSLRGKVSYKQKLLPQGVFSPHE